MNLVRSFCSIAHAPYFRMMLAMQYLLVAQLLRMTVVILPLLFGSVMISPSLLLIDLASAPGGVDANGAQAAGVKVIWALSLPGKYAPVTAGEIIADTVLDHMREEGLL